MAAKLKRRAWLIGIGVIVVATICAPAVAKNARANTQEPAESQRIQSPSQAPEKSETGDNSNQTVEMSQQSIDKSRADDNALTAKVTITGGLGNRSYDVGESVKVDFLISNTSLYDYEGIQIKAISAPSNISFSTATPFSDIGHDNDGHVAWGFPCSIPSQSDLCNEIEMESSEAGNYSVSFGFYSADGNTQLVNQDGSPLTETVTLSFQKPRDDSAPSNLTVH